MKTITQKNQLFILFLGILFSTQWIHAQRYNDYNWQNENNSYNQESQGRYSYYPQQDIYYDNYDKVYRYYENNNWSFSERLPVRCRNIIITNEPVIYTNRIEMRNIRYPEIYVSERAYYGPSNQHCQNRGYYNRERVYYHRNRHCH